MSKIVDMHQHTEYQEKLAEVIESLNDIEGEINNCMIQLATSGKWKQWSDEQPIGTVFQFTEEMLLNTGDKNVDALVELIYKVIETRENLK
jgi:hypothetical protein